MMPKPIAITNNINHGSELGRPDWTVMPFKVTAVGWLVASVHALNVVIPLKVAQR